ncbi:glycerol-3-phosphate dehydrogenase/oxidase [bacterium]|nr:glycerol-3-phosphate dehydrogenase/oxidase [bacterium]
MIVQLRANKEPWDIVVIGGGATGMGVAVEAASRGYKTLLLEQHDFGKGTSSRSTKLVHGGVRYLQQGNVSLVLEALRERAIMRDNAPHLVSDLPFIVPIYDWWEGPFYGIGLRLYDMLAGKHGFGDSRNLSREETIERIPVIETEGLRGGVVYHDGQFDDSRLVINLAQTAAEEGAVLLNYAKVTGLKHVDGTVQGVVVHDEEAGEEFHLEARAVINATGVFTDSIRTLDDDQAAPVIQPSRGIHIVLDRSFLGGDTAIMVPHTDDGRVLFAIPWHDKVIFGTTDTPVDAPVLEPQASREEFDFLLEHAARYLINDPTEKDVLSVFAGLRPLVKEGEEGSTAAISRDHSILISRSGLVTIAGGKWTTYRHMAEETIDQAVAVGQLQQVPSLSRDLPIHGWHQRADDYHSLSMYGSDAPALLRMIEKHPGQGTLLHSALPITEAQVIWAARAEMARTVEDVLARRTRCLLLGARASIDIAPRVASILARELGFGRKWQAEQVDAYKAIAQGYLPEGLK